MSRSFGDASSSSPLVSIVIVNYNGAEVLHACLRSVFAQPYRPIDVIVVDNASSDESVEIVRKNFVEARVIVSDRNLGFAEGNNVGVRASKGEYVVLLNNDATVEEQWLPALLRSIEQPDVAAVTSKVVTDGIPKEFYELNGSINYLGHNIMRQFIDLSQVFYAGGTSLMFKKSIVGLPFLDEYFLYYEDLYLSWRLRLRGFAVRMAQDSVVHHLGNVTTKKQSSALITFYQERNRIINLLLFYESRTLVKLIPFVFFDASAKVLAALFSSRKSLKGTLRAYVWLMTNVQWLRQQRKFEQSSRTVRDSEILTLICADVFDEARSSKAARFFNIIARLYAHIVGLPYHLPAHGRER